MDEGVYLFEPQASFYTTPAGPGSAGCPQRSGGTQTPGSLFLAHLILAKQKKGESPAAATERHQDSATNLMLQKAEDFDRLSPYAWGSFDKFSPILQSSRRSGQASTRCAHPPPSCRSIDPCSQPSSPSGFSTLPRCSAPVPMCFWCRNWLPATAAKAPCSQRSALPWVPCSGQLSQFWASMPYLGRFPGYAWRFKCWVAPICSMSLPVSGARRVLSWASPRLQFQDPPRFASDFLTNITNTKSALFFGSVFAASFPAEPGAALQISAVAIRRQRAVLAHAAGLPVLTAARASRLCAITQHRQPRGLCVARRTGSGAAGVHLPRGPVIRASSHDPRTDKDARQRAVRPDRSGSGRGP